MEYGTRNGEPTLTFRTKAERDAYYRRQARMIAKLEDERRQRVEHGNARPEDLDPFHGLT